MATTNRLRTSGSEMSTPAAYALFPGGDAVLNFIKVDLAKPKGLHSGAIDPVRLVYVLVVSRAAVAVRCAYWIVMHGLADGLLKHLLQCSPIAGKYDRASIAVVRYGCHQYVLCVLRHLCLQVDVPSQLSSRAPKRATAFHRPFVALCMFIRRCGVVLIKALVRLGASVAHTSDTDQL